MGTLTVCGFAAPNTTCSDALSVFLNLPFILSINIFTNLCYTTVCSDRTRRFIFCFALAMHRWAWVVNDPAAVVIPVVLTNAYTIWCTSDVQDACQIIRNWYISPFYFNGYYWMFFFLFCVLQDMNTGMLNPIYAWLMSLTFFSFTGEMNVSH